MDAYHSPEYAENEFVPYGFPLDVYALGMVFYEFLTGDTVGNTTVIAGAAALTEPVDHSTPSYSLGPSSLRSPYGRF